MSQAGLGLETEPQTGRFGYAALTLASRTRPLLGWFPRPTVATGGSPGEGRPPPERPRKPRPGRTSGSTQESVKRIGTEETWAPVRCLTRRRTR